MTTKTYTKALNTAIFTGLFAVIALVMSATPVSAQALYYHVSPWNGSDYHPVYPVTYPVSYPYPVQYPVYQPYPMYPALTVSCSASSNYGYTGNSVIWTAYVSGGNGIYAYSWSGDENLSGYSQTVNKIYYYTGYKYGYVTVYSNGQTASANCGYVNVQPTSNYAYTYPTYNNSYVYATPAPTYVQSYPASNYTLDVGCYADPTNATVNQPVTWNVEVTGGQAPYTYSWTGTDGLSGSQASVIKYYTTTGAKNAIVSVSSADGRTAVRSCSNQLTISPTYRPAAKAPAKASNQQPMAAAPSATPVSVANSALVAGPYLSLANVPWGWVAVLVILVLFATVLYLMFNRDKI
ncbi:MAG: PKD domain-containing protein [Patescibacteria group bacterium]|nr:PKD domain-containing protein [Patescibacteria group bacterium]MDE2172502.1 PKD domain-containing protein [Patescibacteria group bacterium]